MVFSTGDTSMQGTGRDQRQNLAMASQSSAGGMGLDEETKSTGRPVDRSRGAHLDPRIVPQEYPPPELGRASLSESTNSKAK